MDIPTAYGILKQCTGIETDAHTNRLIACMVHEPSPLNLGGQQLLPQYQFDDVRRKYIPSVTFYTDGSLRTIALEDSTRFPTPLGNFPAEYLTFYPDGSLCRLFPLNGKISAYWSEKEEFARSEPFSFTLPIGQFRCKIISLHFYASGSLRSITIAPGEHIQLQTPVGPLAARIGFSLYENGSIDSLEPVGGTTIPTPIGNIPVFDPFALGIHADRNSLHFDIQGNLQSLHTTHAFRLRTPEQTLVIEPARKPSPLDDELLLTLPTIVHFHKDSITFQRRDKTWEVPCKSTSFQVL